MSITKTDRNAKILYDRIKRKMSQRAVAEKYGITRARVQQIENAALGKVSGDILRTAKA